jgi:hypothetical protein
VDTDETPDETLRLYLKARYDGGTLSVPKLARALNIGASAVHMYLNGQRRIPTKRLGAIATFLNLGSASELIAIAEQETQRAAASPPTSAGRPFRKPEARARGSIAKSQARLGERRKTKG